MPLTVEKTTEAGLITSKPHAAGVLFLIVAIGVLGRIFVTDLSSTALRGAHLRIYLGGLAVEWLLFLYVRFGVRRSDVKTVRQIVDESSWSVARWCLYVALAIGATLVWMACGFALHRVLHLSADEVRHLRSLLPDKASDKAYWAVLSISAGFCEEFVYRGYLQQQFRRLSGSLSAAIALQAVCFGVAHASFPWQTVVSVILLALLLGGLAAWWRSLIPGMLLHASFDLLAGLFS
jgi:uncharacterized protein